MYDNEQDWEEYAAIFDGIEDDAAFFEERCLAEDARCDMDEYCNDWESAAWQPDFE